MLPNFQQLDRMKKFENLGGRIFQKAHETVLGEAAIRSKGAVVRESHPKAHGVEIFKHAGMNKGMGFSLRERQMLGIHGLIPPAVVTQADQVDRVMKNIELQPNDLSRYVQLSALQDRNEKLYYRVLTEHIDKLLPIVYTPTVGLACQKFGFIYRRPKGLYITIYDNSVDKILEILSNWPEDDIRAIVVTDGERILGLGDLGAYGMGIPIGKLALYVALARVNPRWCLPIQLDVGTDNETLLSDRFYNGLRHKRIRGEQYDQFVDNFMKAVVHRFGPQTLIQFEDFGNANAFRLLEKYKLKYCTFNDDIQGTASVALAGLLAATKNISKKISDHKIMFYGAGEASIGMANLICMAMQHDAGISFKEAAKRIWMVDSKGLIVKSRSHLTSHKQAFAQDFKEMKNLADIVHELKPTALIGASTIPASFTDRIICDMASFNERPIIFALSNPTSKAECSAEQAYKFSDGRAVFASGSPFPKYDLPNGKTLHPGQGNNAYIFPGVSLGVILCGAHHVVDDLFLLASEMLADMVTKENFDEGRVYPPLSQISDISVKIAAAVVDYCYKKGIAALYPEPENKEEFVRSHMYDVFYRTYEPLVYDYPEGVIRDDSVRK